MSTAPDMIAAKASWHAQIGDLTPEQIRRALDTMPVGPGAFPPGPRGFRKLALTQPAEDSEPPYYAPFPRRDDADYVRPDPEGIAKVRAILAEARAKVDQESAAARATAERRKRIQMDALHQYAAERGVSL